ncbi:hypothetical protein H072_5880 [Dactylellina haptotyla CBS 200.50]|uniref:Swiss Army Knife RNA repair protein HAD domain-containing protein n=1 Tax=Dactylellina haptotyla (strain CBS 200.50) TaxID=1284197 RepID=S8ABK0_DACHA|nr:hypothetical protein H072_5880 [Dactylellina haptotyla CBS 200.50]
MSALSDLDNAAKIQNWSSIATHNPLPAVSQIKSICIIDFDNTLYQSPIPSNIWERASVDILKDKDHLLGGGWWQTPSILDATIEPHSETPRDRDGKFPNRWNKYMVHVARNAEKDPHTLSILLTGRDRKLFSGTILKILDGGQLNFDLVVLKHQTPQIGPDFPTTMEFKQAFLTTLLNHFRNAESMSIYEDRVSHANRFERFGQSFNENRDQQIHPLEIKFDVQYIAETHKNLEPVEEIKQVKFMLQRHNRISQGLRIQPPPPAAKLFKRVYNTGYMLSPEATNALSQKFPLKWKRGPPYTDFFGRYVRIKKGKCELSELEQIGGIGAEVEFETIGVGSFRNSIWGLRVRPVDPELRVLTVDSIPTILLAKMTSVRESEINSIQAWEDIKPGDHRYLRFWATVGEQLRLQISAPRVNPSQDKPKAIYRNWRPPNRPHDTVTIKNIRE